MQQLIDLFPSKPVGRLRFDVFENNKLIETFDDCNLIVAGSRLIQCKLVAGDVAGYSITKIGFGTSSAQAVPGNALLTGAFVKNLAGHSYPAQNSVKFDFTLAAGEANGLPIFELGLLTANGTLYARKVRSAVLLKNSSISIAGSWTITFP
jgi:hypothetical protein